MFLDIKGYSAIDDNKLETFITLALPGMNKIIDARTHEYVNTWGDAIVVASQDIREITHIALDLRDFFFNFDWARHSLPKLQARISLHHGTVWRGSDVFTQRGLISGQCVNLAARIEPVAKPGQVWATKDFVGLLQRESQDLFKSREIGRMHLPKNFGVENLQVIYRSQERHPLAQGPQVAVTIVVKDKAVLLVKRAEEGELTWQFPAGQLKPKAEAEAAAVDEVFEETNIRCHIVRKIAEREHPDTDVYCHYFLAEYVSGDLMNKDERENLAVEWVPPGEALRRFTTDVEPAARALLETLGN
jgi:8-oxo-dGTP pyrophosphatase MutT (NUDIX family)